MPLYMQTFFLRMRHDALWMKCNAIFLFFPLLQGNAMRIDKCILFYSLMKGCITCIDFYIQAKKKMKYGEIYEE